MTQATNAVLSPQESQSDTNLMRDIVFIHKATPEDDELVFWLAALLKAVRSTVFAGVPAARGFLIQAVHEEFDQAA